MSNLKDLFMDLGSEDEKNDGSVEVYADSIRQALKLASKELGIPVDMLDYEVLEKGNSGFFGVGRIPYKVLIVPISKSSEHDDLNELEKKLSGGHAITAESILKDNFDGTFKIRITKSGIFLTTTAPGGRGRPVDINEIHAKINAMKIQNADMAKVEKTWKKASGEPAKIGDWTPNPTYDSTMKFEMSEDEMAAYIHFTPPRFFGRHMEYEEVVQFLKSNNVVVGIDEDKIKEYLDAMIYSTPLLAASGEKNRNGKNAYIDYKVKIDHSQVKFEEDESGKVDFRNLELLENVVVGQVLAVKVPAEEGVPGRTVTNRIIPAKSGKDLKIQYGKGTILSEDGTEITAEINGQVVFKNNKISVEPVYVVPGDVSLETGNIVFLGSVIVQGSVQDNFVVKAAGNIDIKGTVQKAFIEAEGDIFLRQGLVGRDEAKVESTGGSIFSKFIQNANVVAENNIIVPEGIVHSFVDAGDNIYSMGKRARIVGGRIRAGNEVNAGYLGADVSTKTEIWVGINPKILQQVSELENLKNKINEELNQLKLNLKNLQAQKKSGKLPKEKISVLDELTEQDQKLTMRLEEITAELEELNSYMEMIEFKGKVCAEKTAFSGVDIYIKDKKFSLKDPYNNVKFSLEAGDIKIGAYESPEESNAKAKMSKISRRR